jgi:SagB-type dehydrogenase family enzyme
MTMKRFVIALVLVAGGMLGTACVQGEEAAPVAAPIITLPAPEFKSAVTLEQAIRDRRSVRQYAATPLTLAQVSQLLWAAQGITEPTRGLRTAPSAMATYPLRVYLVAANVTDLPAGIYRYLPQGHQLELVVVGDQRANVGGQNQMKTAPALLVYTADLTATAKRVGEKMARDWACLEAGHSAQNVLLEEVALGLIGVPMGGFNAATLRPALKLPESDELLYVLSAGTNGQ